ncbi:TlpA family protein disulfide reductase [Myxococcus sp. CA051A]|uniref:peroxiredoxin family protein n=1 Tax=unclassified Myxococcus TaxID=2648731 RepID=UPI00157BA2F4|nr:MULTISPECIES: TlpA disulfide reductase family protein [unclassified Myxococcus]NTX04946.1 TlpA family protein disulfide reductase [Myxococcus sp. CA040A]NTX61597.1 TlpA family protein disulfide reductase [Myxococcus sp. CA051A]
MPTPTHDIPLTLLDPDGGWINAPVHVSELDELPVLLHFFSMASDAHANDFAALKRFLAEFGPRGLKVIGVDVTHSARELRDTNAVEAFAREHGLVYPIAVDDGSMAQAYGVKQTPAWLVFDADRRLRHHFAGKDAARKVRPVLDRFTQYDTSAGAPAP